MAAGLQPQLVSRIPERVKSISPQGPQPLRLCLGVTLDANFGSFVPSPSLGDSGTELRR